MTVQSNMIGRFMVAMETNSKNVCYVTTYLIFVSSMTSMGCLTSKLQRFPYLATQRRCYVTMTANV